MASYKTTIRLREEMVAVLRSLYFFGPLYVVAASHDPATFLD
jgi:hypothetical protein